jgi:hypothetical protein
MGAQRAPIDPYETAAVRRVRDITLLVSGLPTLPKASSPPRRTCLRGKGRRFTSAVKAGSGNISQGPRRDKVTARAARRSSHEWSHGSQAGPVGSVTVSDGDWLRERAPTRRYTG